MNDTYRRLYSRVVIRRTYESFLRWKAEQIRKELNDNCIFEVDFGSDGRCYDCPSRSDCEKKLKEEARELIIAEMMSLEDTLQDT